MRAGRKTKTKHSSGPEVCTIDEPQVQSSVVMGPEQEECFQLFHALRSDPKQLLNAFERNAFMEKIGKLRDKLNQKQCRLQEALASALNVKNDPIGSWVGPKVQLKDAEFLFAAGQTQQDIESSIRKNLENLQKIGCSVRKIQEDSHSLFRALAFGLLEKGVDMRPHFVTREFSVLPTRTQRLLKESFERIRKNPTILQLEMEMNIQEVSNAWVCFLRQMAEQGHEKSGGAEIKSPVEQHEEAVTIDVLSKRFNIPMQVVHTHYHMPRLEKNAICLLKTPRQIDLLYL
jgi:hypothetical protein